MRAERELRQGSAHRSLRKLQLTPSSLRAADQEREEAVPGSAPRPGRRRSRAVLIIGDGGFRNRMERLVGRAGSVGYAPPASSGEVTTLATTAPADQYDVVVVQDEALAEVATWRHLWHKRARMYVVDDASGDDALAPTLPLWGRFLKRALDIVVAAAALVIALPLLIAIAVAVKLDTEGPAFFVQTRVGADGRKFRFVKFRTMVVNNDDAAHLEYVASLIRGEEVDHGGIFKLAADPRITRVGRFLRRYSLDELPQLLNVLLGDMTLVGPRPAMPCETDLYDVVAWQRLRVKPGLTGLWQVSGRCELTFWEMVDLDVAYWRQWTPWLDLRILVRTPMAVLTARGAA